MSRVIQRIFAKGTWRAESAIHLGGEADGSPDMALLRDSDGRFLIPGASIAGAARHYLFKALEARKHKEAALALFGDKYTSLLTVRDAPAMGSPTVFVRDGVRIDAKSGTAADYAKYDFEVLPAGTSFAMEVAMLVYNEMPDGTLPEEVIGCFRAMLDAFSTGEIRLGARTRRGLGEGRVGRWEVRRLDMARRDHLAAWLRQRPWDAVDADLGDAAVVPLNTNESRSFRIEADLKLVTSLLVRSPGEGANSPDATHLTENGRAILPGTGIAGALRARCELIARHLWGDRAKERLDGLFGPHGAQGVPLHASRVITSETEVAGSSCLVQARVAIDRFTGGSKETALFEEAALWPNEAARNLRFHVAVRKPADKPGDTQEQKEHTAKLFEAEAGLMLLAFKDLWTGEVALGGGSGIGRGVVRGVEARIYETGKEILHMTARSEEGAVDVVPTSNRARVEALVRAAQEAAA